MDQAKETGFETLADHLIRTAQADPDIFRENLEDQMNRLTLYDEKGYHTWRYGMRSMDQLRREGRLGRRAAAMFNLRHFAAINRELGRKLSDEVMRQYVQQMEEACGEEGFVCRLWGDNFLLLCDQDRLGSVISHLEGTLVIYGEEKHRLTVQSSAGLFLIGEQPGDVDLEDILERVSNAFHVARTNSQGEIVFSDEKLEIQREKELDILKRFPSALNRGEFKVYYQPKINVETSEIVGAEALSRWIRDGETVMPGDFIPVLERSMDICRLDFYVLEQVCRDISRWLAEGRRVVRVSVNMSRKHLAEEDMLERIMDIIDMYETPHEYIEIEMTETTTSRGLQRMTELVKGLQEMEIRTAVDDFGIGYSSLKLIRDIPWNVIKVDRKFIPLDTESEKSVGSIMFRNVVKMVNEMGMECVAEGVETKEQVQRLRWSGCPIAQGFFYDKPLPVHEFEKRLDWGRYAEEEQQ